MNEILEEKKEIEDIIVEINSDDEFDKFIKTVDESSFSLNKFRWKGVLSIRWSGINYSFKESGKSFVEDYYHKGVWIAIGSGFRVHTNILIRPGSTKKFSRKDSDSWVRVDYNDVKAYETLDRPALERDLQYILVQSKIAGPLEVNLKDEQLLSLGFVRGSKTPEYWFYHTEVDYIDNYLPYRKFDNTYKKVDIKKGQLRMKSDGYKSAEIKAWVNESMKENILFGTDTITYSSFEGIDYTFGVEIETCIGRLDQKDVRELNVKAVHDGSLRDADGNTPGGEYVTGVLKGDSGLVQLAELCRVISTRCKVNHQCGVHVHCGTLNWGKEDVVYAYVLAEMLEKELFNMLPSSRRNNSYCRPLSPITGEIFKDLSKASTKGGYNILIDDLYNEIYKEVTFIKSKNGQRNYVLENRESDEHTDIIVNSRTINKNVNHPLGTKCGYDKNAQRYCWLNFVTLLYDTKGNKDARTLEFRSHSATMNFIKIKNWIKICFAFCKFVEAHKTLINQGGVTLSQVLLNVYPKSGKELAKYVDERTQLFKTSDESVDYIDKAIPNKQSIKEVVECA